MGEKGYSEEMWEGGGRKMKKTNRRRKKRGEGGGVKKSIASSNLVPLRIYGQRSGKGGFEFEDFEQS